jgi:cyclic pyranopterin phosphate synthase
LDNTNSKGDVLGVARIAGIMAAKRTAELIPLCHPIAITNVDLTVQLLPPESSHPWIANRKGLVLIEASVRCTGPTGVEMEALTAASVAGLTVYDMCKAVDKDIRMQVRLIKKSGGRSGTWTWSEYHEFPDLDKTESD